MPCFRYSKMSLSDPLLFVRPYGLPAVFMMLTRDEQSKKLKQLIEERGGVLLDRPNNMYKDNVIRLQGQREVYLKRDLDIFNSKYIFDCVENDELLSNLNDYKIKSHIPSCYSQYDAIDILLGYRKWSDLSLNDGDRVSDIEEDSEIVLPSRSNTFKSSKMPYSKKHQQAIVDYLVKHSAYKMVNPISHDVFDQHKAMGGGDICGLYFSN